MTLTCTHKTPRGPCLKHAVWVCANPCTNPQKFATGCTHYTMHRGSAACVTLTRMSIQAPRGPVRKRAGVCVPFPCQSNLRWCVCVTFPR